MAVKSVSHIDKFVPQPERMPKAGISSAGESFKQALNIAQSKSANSGAIPQAQLKFSHHALERMHSRGIHLNVSDLNRLEEAVERARKKGSHDSLVLMGDSAFVVSVKNKTVITCMDRNMMKNNVFTNIDSTIIV